VACLEQRVLDEGVSRLLGAVNIQIGLCKQLDARRRKQLLHLS
jgi:hypothetical protein